VGGCGDPGGAMDIDPDVVGASECTDTRVQAHPHRYRCAAWEFVSD
jgi:hypothetical protein